MKGTKARSWGLAAWLLALALAAGCGSNAGTSPASTDTGQGAATEQGETESEATRRETPAQTRTVVDEIGHELEIPAQPERVIGLYLEDELTALGVTPIRQSRIGSWSGQAYLQLDVPDIDMEGSIEAFVEAKPDLILTNVYNPTSYEALEQIAPFYAFEDARKDWRATIRKLGELLNKSDQAEKVIRDYEDRAAAANEQLRAVLGEQTVAIVRVHSKEIRLYGGPGYAGPVLYGELGLKPAPLVQKLVLDQGLGVAAISMEVIPDLDADHIFLTVDTGAEAQYDALVSNPLWTRLSAVQAGQVHEVDFETWMKSGPIADSRKIEDVVKALAS